MPLLPSDVGAVRLKTVDGLGNGDRTEYGARGNGRRVIIIGVGGHGYDAGVDDADDLLLLGIPESDHAFDRMSKAGREAAGLGTFDALEAAAFFLGGGKIAGRIAIAFDSVEIGNAAFAHSGLPLGIGFEEAGNSVGLVGDEDGFDAFNFFPGDESMRRDVDEGLEGLAALFDDVESLARKGAAGMPCEDGGFGRFVEVDAREAAGGGEFARGFEGFVDGPIFGRSEGVEGVSGELGERVQWDE